LPFGFGRRDQIADQDHEQIIINHRAVVVAVQAAAALFEDRAPKEHGAGERDQSEGRAQKIIPAIHERVLEPDVEDRNVLVDPGARHFSEESSTARLIAAIMLSGRAIPLPAISNAVPWSGLVRGKGRPSVTFTPLWNACSFNGINP